MSGFALEESPSVAEEAPIEGLDRYVQAPFMPPWPQWAQTECDVWIRLKGACRPMVAIDPPWTPRRGIQTTESGRRYLEVTTCELGPTTCGIAFRASSHIRPLHTWCRRGSAEITGAFSIGDEYLTVVDIDDDSALYASVIRLSLEDIDPFVVVDTCDGESLRAGWDFGPPYTGEPPSPVRHCYGSAGFRVVEPSDDTTPPRTRIVGETVDCRIPCASGYHKARAAADRRLRYLFVEPHGLALEIFRSEAACRAAGDQERSPVPSDLCTTLGPRITSAVTSSGPEKR